MKPVVSSLCILIAAALTASHKTEARTAPAAPAPSPLTQKPGLWTVTTRMAQMPKGMTTSLCLDATLGGRMTELAMIRPGHQNCSQSNMRRSGASVDVDSTCTMDGRTFVSHIHMERTSDTAYTQTITSHSDRGDMTVTTTGAWQGACPAGMKPGDMAMPGGVRMNMYDMLKAAGN